MGDCAALLLFSDRLLYQALLEKKIWYLRKLFKEKKTTINQRLLEIRGQDILQDPSVITYGELRIVLNLRVEV